MSATTHKERPILFSGPMVRALLEGRKTQTRRVVKFSVEPGDVELVRIQDGYPDGVRAVFGVAGEVFSRRCHYGVPGDRLWVRESLEGRIDTTIDPAETMPIAAYSADGAHLWTPDKFRVPWQWQRPTLPSIHMPRWASRITLEITDIRVERLKDISEADKAAEGATPDMPFGTVWRRINTAPGIRWEDNPWVWVISFCVAKGGAA